MEIGPFGGGPDLTPSRILSKVNSFQSRCAPSEKWSVPGNELV